MNILLELKIQFVFPNGCCEVQESTIKPWQSMASVACTQSLLRSREDVLEVALVLQVEIVEVLDLVAVGLLLPLGELGVLAVDLLDLLLQVFNVLFVLLDGRLEVGDVLSHFVFALLRHERLSHAVSDRALVEGLVGLDRHLDLISHTDEEEAALGSIDSDLSDQLVEALGEEFFAEGADASLSSLGALERSIEFVLQVDHVDLSGWLG